MLFYSDKRQVDHFRIGGRGEEVYVEDPHKVGQKIRTSYFFSNNDVVGKRYVSKFNYILESPLVKLSENPEDDFLFLTEKQLVGRSRCAADEPRAILLVHNGYVVISLHPVIGRKRPGKGTAATSTITEEVTMNTTMPQDPHFSKQYQQHLQCLKLCGLQPKTIEAYARAIRRIGNYFDCRIDNLSSSQLLDYFTELLDTHSWSAVKLDLYGLKFFYARVLNKPWEDIPLIKPPKTSRIPDILSVEQMGQLFAATRILSYKVFFFACYSMGLRLGEGIRLTVGDIDADNMRGHIRDAKGNKDRLVPLPDKTLRVLREFWAVHKHPRFLFPSRKRGLKNAHLVDLPLDRGGIQTAMQSVVRQLGIKKNLMPLPAPQLRYPHAGVRSRSA